MTTAYSPLSQLDGPASPPLMSSNTSGSCSSLTGLKDKRFDKQSSKIQRKNVKLIDAAFEGNIEDVNSLLNENASPNATCQETYTNALHVAAFKGYVEIVELLLERGADPERRDKAGLQAAHFAAFAGKKSCLEKLASHKEGLLHSEVERNATTPDLTELDSWTHHHENLSFLKNEKITMKMTPLHLACKNRKYECLQFLVSKNASNAPDAEGLTPLDILSDGEANEKRGSQQQDTLMDRERLKNTLRQLSSNSGQSSTNEVKKLANQRPRTGLNFSQVAAASVLLKSHGISNDKSYLTLNAAIAHEEDDIIDEILRADCDLSMKNRKGKTPLHVALNHKNYAAMEKILAKNSGIVNEVDNKRKSCLHKAVTKGCKEGVTILLEYGARLDVPNRDMDTVFHVASRKGHGEIMEVLLTQLVTDENVEGIKSDGLLNRSNKSGLTPLMEAVKNSKSNCVRLLTDYNANIQCVTPAGETVLHLCAEYESSTDIVEHLLEHKDVGKIFIKQDYKMSRTPLHLAASKGNFSMTKILLNKLPQSATKLEDSDKCQPLHLAALHGHKECITSLLKHNGDLSAVEERSKTVLDLISLSVAHPTDFLLGVFDSFIEKNNYRVNEPECEVTVRFDLLIPENLEEGSQTPKLGRKQMSVLLSLLNVGRENMKESLLLHPIVETFLYLKWQKLQIFFWFLMALYTFFTLSISAVNFFDHVYESSEESVVDKCRSMVLHIALFITFVMTLAIELVNLRQLNPYYLKDPETWAKFAMFILVLLYIPNRIWLKWELIHAISPLMVLLAWLQLLLLLGRNPKWGYYVLMFTKVASNLFKVVTSFIILFTGFSFAFMIYFKIGVSRVYQQLIKTVVMTVEVGYDGLDEQLDWVGRFLVLAFVLLVALALNNLTAALAVNDVSELETQGRTSRLVKQIDFFNLIEVFFCQLVEFFPRMPICWIMMKQMEVEGKIVIKPGIPKNQAEIQLPGFLRESLLERATLKEALSVDKRLDQIESLLLEIKRKVEQGYSVEVKSTEG